MFSTNIVQIMPLSAGKFHLTPHVRRVALHLFCWVLALNSKDSIKIVNCNFTAPQVNVSCQFQLYDIIKFKFLNYRPWENPVVQCDDLESGRNEIVSIVLKNTSSIFIFDVFDDEL